MPTASRGVPETATNFKKSKKLWRLSRDKHMETTPMHGLGVLLFFLGLTLISAGCLMGGSMLLILLGIVVAGVSVVVLRRTKSPGVQS
jgi:hypothetical protein